MGITFDRALGVHPAALQLRLHRAELLATNLANVDTPNFQAKDMDFTREMQRAAQKNAPQAAPELLYRRPAQPAEDGNTVSLEVEQAEFAKNQLDHQVSLQFLNARFRSLKQAIEGR